MHQGQSKMDKILQTFLVAFCRMKMVDLINKQKNVIEMGL